ncbi:hypothetical protein [Massilia sp. MS-15]|uniref:hypothetical protein n=1 Tax=Massilia sp. MS-15 TaxID=2878200 RepID=UPI001CD20184|nr:hypothetical protein [Massilia sp. MS-15]MCA1245227.1 hypothetical protein [Massilia sp. MS-15]
MASSNFLLCYASVTTALFEHIEDDMLDQSLALLDDDFLDDGAPPAPVTGARALPLLDFRCHPCLELRADPDSPEK